MPESRAVSLPWEMQYKNLLFDFYGGLLTEKQREYFAMHYMDDLSLAEIGEQSGTTPQAVADLLKRTCALLEKYEQKLSLVALLLKQRAHVDFINENLRVIEQSGRETGMVHFIKLADVIRKTVNDMVI
jgi:hypothetical protein